MYFRYTLSATNRECVCFQNTEILKNENPRFMSLFDKHNKLDHEIARKEGSDGRGYNAEVVRMKKQKLQLKDEMLKILQQESVKEV